MFVVLSMLLPEITLIDVMLTVSLYDNETITSWARSGSHCIDALASSEGDVTVRILRLRAGLRFEHSRILSEKLLLRFGRREKV